MPLIHINLGSNTNRAYHINRAVDELRKIFNHLQQSAIYQSPAVGFTGNDFYNTGVNIKTQFSVQQVFNHLHAIEHKLGRDRNQPKFSSRVIDLDLVLYGSLVSTQYRLPRADILRYAFVLAPLVELMPNTHHPIEKKTYRTLWQAFDLQQKNSLIRL